MATNTQVSCFCMGKAPGCTCGGRCRCFCTCWKDKLENTFGLDWMPVIENPDLISEDVVGQVIAKNKKYRQPPNCS